MELRKKTEATKRKQLEQLKQMLEKMDKVASASAQEMKKSLAEKIETLSTSLEVICQTWCYGCM